MWAPHIDPINSLVDQHSKPPIDWIPYVPPLYGGVEARLLTLMRDPGPKTLRESGSGFICLENDDPTAERLCVLFERSGIDARLSVPWNVYPWYINRKPNANQIARGASVLAELIDLLPYLRVVMLHGDDAVAGWKKLIRFHPEAINNRCLHVIDTYHTGNRAFIGNKDIVVRRLDALDAAFAAASGTLRAAVPPVQMVYERYRAG